MAEEEAPSKRAKEGKRIIALFDVDGTLTPARKEVAPEVLEFLAALRKKM